MCCSQAYTKTSLITGGISKLRHRRTPLQRWRKEGGRGPRPVLKGRNPARFSDLSGRNGLWPKQGVLVYLLGQGVHGPGCLRCEQAQQARVKRKESGYALRVSVRSGPGRPSDSVGRPLTCAWAASCHLSLLPSDRCSLLTTCRPPPPAERAALPILYLQQRRQTKALLNDCSFLTGLVKLFAFFSFLSAIPVIFWSSDVSCTSAGREEMRWRSAESLEAAFSSSCRARISSAVWDGEQTSEKEREKKNTRKGSTVYILLSKRRHYRFHLTRL